MPTLHLLTTHCDSQPPIVELTINEQPYKFLIDTGASRTHIHPILLPALKQLSYRAVQVSGIGGTHELHEARVTFNFAGVTIYTVYIDPSMCTDVFIGVIGCDILRQFRRVIIDNERQTITFVQ